MSDYFDDIDRTFGLYRTQICQAIDQLKKEIPDFGGIGGRYNGTNFISGYSWMEMLILEDRVKKMTGDPRSRLVRTLSESNLAQDCAQAFSDFD